MTDPSPSCEYSKTFAVRVGKYEEYFFVHQHIFSKTSAFFRGISFESWQLGHTIPVDLLEVNADSFKLYTHWAHTGIFAMGCCSFDENHDAHEQRACIEAYILGDFLDDPEYRAHVMSIIIAKLSSWRRYISNDLIRRIWGLTHSASPLRTFALHWMLGRHSEFSLAHLECRSLPREFLAEVLSLAMKCSTSVTDG